MLSKELLYGCLPSKVSFRIFSASTTFYLVPNGTSMLGRDLLTALKMMVVDGSIKASQSDVQPSQKGFPCSPSVKEDASVQEVGCS